MPITKSGTIPSGNEKRDVTTVPGGSQERIPVGVADDDVAGPAYGPIDGASGIPQVAGAPEPGAFQPPGSGQPTPQGADSAGDSPVYGAISGVLGDAGTVAPAGQERPGDGGLKYGQLAGPFSSPTSFPQANSGAATPSAPAPGSMGPWAPTSKGQPGNGPGGKPPAGTKPNRVS